MRVLWRLTPDLAFDLIQNMKLEFSVDRKTFSDLLKPSNPLEIPPFQRPYSWKPEHWDKLWEDITERLDSEYLMGGIVLCGSDNSDKTLMVIDGQQRLSTITTLIAACRDYLWKECGTDKARLAAIGIHNQYIVSGGVDAEKNEPFLILGELDCDWFAEKIQVSPQLDNYSPPDVAQVKKKLASSSHRLLWRAYQFFYKQLLRRHEPTSSISTVDLKIEDIKKITRHLGTKCWFVVTKVTDDTQAFKLFEVLNDRGLELSISDLIKNVILSQAARLDRLEEAKTQWSNIVDSLDYENIAPFLRYFWMSHNGKKITEDDLLDTLKSKIKKMGASDLILYLKSLAEEAENFAEIIGRTPIKEELMRELNLIKAYGFRVGNSVILAVWFASKDHKVRLNTLRQVKNFLVKYAVFANEVTNVLEDLMAKIALSIRSELNGGLAMMEATFNEKQPACKTIEDKFLKIDPSINVARALLVEIETHLAGTEKLPADTSKVEVEHIFPQSPTPEWLEYYMANGNEETYVGRLGNLTLLGQKLNKQLSNRPYKDKRKTYFKKSDFTITKDLGAVNKWTFKAVEKRQAQLLKHAKKIWDIK